MCKLYPLSVNDTGSISHLPKESRHNLVIKMTEMLSFGNTDAAVIEFGLKNSPYSFSGVRNLLLEARARLAKESPGPVKVSQGVIISERQRKTSNSATASSAKKGVLKHAARKKMPFSDAASLQKQKLSAAQPSEKDKDRNLDAAVIVEEEIPEAND